MIPNEATSSASRSDNAWSESVGGTGRLEGVVLNLRDNLEALSALFVTFAFIAGRLCTAVNTAPRTLPDSAVYLGLSHTPVLSTEFWTGGRPPTVPLLYKVSPSLDEVVGVQTLVAGAGWVVLAIAIFIIVQNKWAGVVGLGFVYLIALTGHVAMWDAVLHSEALSFGLFAGSVGFALLALDGGRRWSAVGFLVTTTLWVFARDTNAYLAIGWLLVAVAILVVRRCSWQWWVVPAVLAAVIATSITTADVGERWLFPFFNVLGQRILVSEQATEHFAKRGMPTSPSVTDLKGKWASEGFYEDENEPLREWARREGKSTYIAYLLKNPGQTLAEPFTQLQLTQQDLKFAAPDGFRTVVPDRLGRLVVPLADRWQLTVMWLVAVGVSLTVGLRNRFRRGVVPLTLALAAPPFFVLVWHGDAMEIARHSVEVPVHVAVAFWISLVMLFGSSNGSTES